METSPNASTHGKDVVQSDYLNPGEAGFADSLGNTEPNINWVAEPNFNLNLASPRNPRQATETSKLHGGNKNNNETKGDGKPGAKGAVTIDAGKSKTPVMSPEERGNPSRQKSKIPAMSRSPTAEASVNNRDEQRLRSPNPKRTPTLSPKPHAHSNTAASPKPQSKTIASSPMSAEREKTPGPRAESASISNLKPHPALMSERTTTTTKSLKLQTNRKDNGGKDIGQEIQSPKTLHPPVNQNQKGDSKPANRTPTMTAKTKQPEPASTKSNEKVGHDSRTTSSEKPSLGPKLQNQRAEMALLSTKTPQPISLSPKPSTQRKASGIKNSNASGSKEHLDNKDLSNGSGSKTSSKSSSNSGATTETKDSLYLKTSSDSKASPNSETNLGSKDSLDSKSVSVSKTSWGSKDSLDFKTGSNSKASSYCKSGMGSRDSLDSKTATEIKASRPSPDPKATSDSSKPGPVLVSSKSALADLSSSSTLSPRPSSAKRSPGSGPGKSLGSLGLNREVQRSPGSTPGNYINV